MRINEIERQNILSLASRIVFTFIGFLSTMYFSHVLGAEILGSYFLFLSYIGIVNIVGDGGFGTAAIKRISEGKEPNKYFTAFLLIKIIFTSSVILSLSQLRWIFVDLNAARLFDWLLISIGMFAIQSIASTGIVGQGKVGVSAITGFINHISRVFVQVIAVFLGFEVIGLVGGLIFGIVIGALLDLRFFDLKLSRFRLRHLKSLSTFSFWVFLTSSGAMMYMYTDRILIGYFLGNMEVGIYQITIQLASFGTFTTVSLISVLWPKVSRWNANQEFELIEKSFSKAITYSLILAVPTLIGGVLLGDKMLYFFYGAEFVKGNITFSIILIVQIVNVFNLFFTTYLGAMNRQKDAFKVTVAAAISNVILNLLLIPIIGIEGAAIATLVSMSISAVFAYYIIKNIINIKVEVDSLINILKASCVMGIIVGIYRLLFPLDGILLLLIPIFIGGVAYVVLILKFDKNVRDAVKNILSNE